MTAAVGDEIEPPVGGTQHLRALCESWEDIRKTRMACQQRGRDDLADDLRKMEEREGRKIKKELMALPIWEWLSQFPGLGGVHTARLISRIEDPRKFPGQRCTEGHYFPPMGAMGQPCPVPGCGGTTLEPRPGTGVRSIWHFAGLHVGDDGRSPRKQKGQRVDWDPVARTCVLQPDGIADQIIKLRVPKYRDIYDAQKERIARERGVAVEVASVLDVGPADENVEIEGVGGEADDPIVIEGGFGLRPVQIHERARKIAAKAFVGDLIVEWKKVA